MLNSEIIKEVVKALKTNDAQFIKDIQSYNTLISTIDERKKGIPGDVVRKILQKFPTVNESWLLRGEKPVLIEDAENSQLKDEAKQVPFEDFMEVPYLPVIAQAGYLTGYADNHTKDLELHTLLVPREFDKGRYLVVEVNGDSMDDDSKRSICDGDKLLTKEVDIDFLMKNERYYKANLFIVMTREDGVVVKEITTIDKKLKLLILHSWNPANGDFPVKFNELIRIMVVKKIVERRIKL